MTRVCGFLGASTDPTVLQACCAAADFPRLSGGRSRGQEDRGSFFRQGLPGDWRRLYDAYSDLAFRTKVERWISTVRYR